MTRSYSLSGFVLLAAAFSATAAPSGANVTHGSATISESVDANGHATTTIDVGGAAAKSTIIDWQEFSIDPGETVKFIDNKDAATLNRVTGNNVSRIYGNLTASGKIFLVNPNGIVFGNNATVDVGGLVASTTGISDQNFIAGYETGRYKFDESSSGYIQIEAGGMTIKNAGLAALVAPSVENLGVIKAEVDKLVLASGDIYTLDLYGDNLITFDASSAVANIQSGSIQAGDEVYLMADAADNLLEGLVNVDGLVQATNVVLSGDTVQLVGAGTVEATTTDVYYKTDDYTQQIDYASLIAGDVTSYMWVENATDLQNIDQANALVLAGNYALRDNIDLSQTSFNPIGDASNAFSGTFDFNGHSIDNLNINQTANYTGLFAVVKNGTIIDAELNNASVSGNHYTGALAGYAYDATLLEGVEVNLTGVSGVDYVGGVFGNMHNTTIEGPVSVQLDGDISGRQYVGGVSGYISGNTNIAENSYISVAGDHDITASGYATGSRWRKYYNASVGGIAGVIFNKSADSSSFGDIDVNVNDINGNGRYVGGTAGQIYTAGDLSLGNVSVTANNISGTHEYVGGIAGDMEVLKSTDFQNMQVSANTIKGSKWVGGLFGLYGTNNDNNYSFDDLDVTANYIGAHNGKNAYEVAGLFGELNGRGSTFDFDGDVNVTVNEIHGINTSGGLFGRLGMSTGSIGNGYSQINFNQEVNLEVDTLNGQDYNGYGGYRTGGIAGYTYYTDIRFAHAPNMNINLIQGGYNLGGAFGEIAYSTITGNLTNYATISSDYGNVGGLIGYANNITNNGSLVNYGNVSGESYYVAGVIGYVEDSNLSHLGNHGDISGTDTVGGVFGYASRSDLAYVYNVNEDGYVMGETLVGGIGGQLGWKSSLTHAISASDVIATDTSYGEAGGIVAYNDGVINNGLVLNTAVIGADGYTGAIASTNYGSIDNILLDTARASVNDEVMTMVAYDDGYTETSYFAYNTEEYYRNDAAYKAHGFDFDTDWQLVDTNNQAYYATQQWCGSNCAIAINVAANPAVKALDDNFIKSTMLTTPAHKVNTAIKIVTAPGMPVNASMTFKEMYLNDKNNNARYSSLNYYSLEESMDPEAIAYAGTKLNADFVKNAIAIETFAKDYHREIDVGASHEDLKAIDFELADRLIDISASN